MPSGFSCYSEAVLVPAAAAPRFSVPNHLSLYGRRIYQMSARTSIAMHILQP